MNSSSEVGLLSQSINFHSQQGSIAKGEQNAPGVSQTPAQNSAPTHVTPLPNTFPPDPLQGFELQAEGHAHHIRKPSSYVHDIQEGQIISSTHQNDPALLHRPQQPSHTQHHATMAVLEDGMDDKQSPVTYAMMAAANIMGIDPVLISNVKKCEDWPECQGLFSLRIYLLAEVVSSNLSLYHSASSARVLTLVQSSAQGCSTVPSAVGTPQFDL